MRALLVPNTKVISKEQLIAELIADGVTIIDDTVPEVIRVEMTGRMQFDTWLTSGKLAGANSEDYENKLRFQTDASTTINPNTTSTVSTTHHNWGLAAMTQDSTTLSTTFTYNQTGANVDVVIMDTGIVVGHPEFNDLSSNTTSRINQINWGGTQGGSFYTDPDGHGTHCAGIAAGRTQGWARDAQIYSFTSNLGGLTHGYNVSSMGYITSWHNSKGTGRPTVVNMSWAIATYYPPNHPSYFHSTASWDPTSDKTYHMTRSSSYDTLVQNMVNAGIVVVCSAGNDNERIYDTAEAGWNSGYWYFFDSNNDMGYGINEKIYKEDASAHDPAVHGTGPRAGTPGAPPGGSYGNTVYFQATNNGQTPGNAWLDPATATRYDISVQSCDNAKNKSSFSNYGTPNITWAPGSLIMSSYINKGSAQQLASTGYYYNKLNGTSMASPQIAGLVACYLDTDSTTFGAVTTSANQQSAQNFIQTNDRDNDIVDWGDGLTNLHRAYQPYQDYTKTWTTSAGSIGSVNENTPASFDLSSAFTNAASESLHTVTHSIQSGSIPASFTLDSNGTLSGTPSTSEGGQTYNFTVRADNGFDNEDRAFSLTINDTASQVKVTGGVRMRGLRFR